MSDEAYKMMVRLRWVPVCGLVLVAFAFALRLRSAPEAGAGVGGRPPAEAPAMQRAKLAEAAWDRFQPASGASARGALAGRFRLAGTFLSFASADGGSPQRRNAILDDLDAKQQYLVVEGDVVGEAEVRTIFQERVILHYQGRDEELWLSFSDARRPAPAAAPAEGPSSFEDLPALEQSRFGKRVGENRWVLQREELLRYYQELMDDPQRLAGVFLSMQPVADPGEDGGTTGFSLDPQGEEAFFAAMGLKPGDVVREVNSMRMVSERRAEYLFREFFENRLNAFVFDVERSGQREKLIYLIR